MSWNECECGKPIFEETESICDWCKSWNSQVSENPTDPPTVIDYSQSLSLNLKK